jgi:hypothetical protein
MVLFKNLPVERTVKQQTRVSSKIDIHEFHEFIFLFDKNDSGDYSSD